MATNINVKYRDKTTDTYGTKKGSSLTVAEVDDNFYNIGSNIISSISLASTTDTTYDAKNEGSGALFSFNVPNLQNILRSTTGDEAKDEPAAFGKLNFENSLIESVAQGNLVGLFGYRHTTSSSVIQDDPTSDGISLFAEGWDSGLALGDDKKLYGGGVSILGGHGSGDSGQGATYGGDINITSGRIAADNGTNNYAGSVTILAGTSSMSSGSNATSIAGGSVVIGAGNSFGSSFAGGSVYISAGVSRQFGVLSRPSNMDSPLIELDCGTGTGSGDISSLVVYGSVGNTFDQYAYQVKVESMRLTSELMSVNGAIIAGGDITAYSTSTSSDAKLKKNIKIVDNALDKVCQLEGVTYDWIEGKRGSSAGVIAQNVEEVLPRAVKEVKDLNGDDSHKVVDYNQLSALFIEAIKELKDENKELRAMIEEIKSINS